MQVKFSVDLNEAELRAVAGHGSQVDYNDVRRFLRTAIRDAIEDATVEYEAATRDLSRTWINGYAVVTETPRRYEGIRNHDGFLPLRDRLHGL